MESPNVAQQPRRFTSRIEFSNTIDHSTAPRRRGLIAHREIGRWPLACPLRGTPLTYAIWSWSTA
jgi:hypothetical protein